MKNTIMFIIIIYGFGLYSIFCAVKNFDWFIRDRKAWLFLKLFGETGTRIAYIVLGVAFVSFATYFLLSSIKKT